MSMGETSGAQEPPQYQVQRIREALAHDPGVGELELDVNIRAGKVLVTGTVPSSEVQHRISELVREVLPGLEVHNQTQVVHLETPDEEERL
jgi:hypothetical protein